MLFLMFIDLCSSPALEKQAPGGAVNDWMRRNLICISFPCTRHDSNYDVINLVNYISLLSATKIKKIKTHERISVRDFH